MIDTSVQLNNHNSYHATENYWCTLYGVQTQNYVTVSFAVYATSTQSASNLVKLRFYTESGSIVGESSHMFAVDTIWNRVSVTSQVPATAKNMQICFLSGAYWWAEPKAEGGEIATAYSTNTAGALTWMTANGIYTGTVTASQVILSNSDPLDTRLATLNSSMLKLSSDVSSTSASITEIKAGQATFVKAADLANAGSTAIDGSNITTGTISASRIGASSITASKLKVTTLSSITSNLGAITGGSLNIGSGTFKVTSSGALTATSANISGKITATSGSIKNLSCSNLTISGSTYSGKVTSNSSSSLGGSLNYAGGYLSSVGGSYNGSINSSGYFGGSISSGGTFSGSLSSASGSFYGNANGGVYSATGTLGGVSYGTYTTNEVKFGGYLRVQGLYSYNAVYASTYGTSSDIRLKENIIPLTAEQSEKMIKQIKPVQYKFKQSEGNHYGVIAQDLVKVLDQETADIFVQPTSEGYFSVDYTSLQMATIPVIQDLLTRVERLENAGTSNL